MEVFGVVCEYNPFHNGHLWLLQQARRRLGEEALCVCAMSGDMVQRGEAALLPKRTRAQMAVMCGADLVLETPLPCVLSSAEGFARGAVSLLHQAGARTLVFGSECGDEARIRRAAWALEEQSAQGEIARQMALGRSYPTACQAALERADEALGPLLSGANDTLAVAYGRAAARQVGGMELLAVPRRGVGHDAAHPAQGVASASWLRQRWERGETVEDYVPQQLGPLLAQSRALAPQRERWELICLTALRLLPPEGFDELFGDSEGLSRRLRRAVGECGSWPALLERSKSKRYPMSRVKRLALSAVLGLKREDEALVEPPYLRVLGLSDRGRPLLRQAAVRPGALPQVVKPLTAWRKMESPSGRRLLGLERRAADLIALARGLESVRRGGEDVRLTPYYQEKA